MGARFDVSVWHTRSTAYGWDLVYMGDSRMRALLAWARAVAFSGRPVKLVWRPR